jgi:hypothetical protein
VTPVINPPGPTGETPSAFARSSSSRAWRTSSLAASSSAVGSSAVGSGLIFFVTSSSVAVITAPFSPNQPFGVKGRKHR